MDQIRGLTARWLVRWAARWTDASYRAYVRVDRDGFPSWYAAPWHFGARQVNCLAIPLASKLNSRAAGEEMVKHGWWG